MVLFMFNRIRSHMVNKVQFMFNMIRSHLVNKVLFMFSKIRSRLVNKTTSEWVINLCRSSFIQKVRMINTLISKLIQNRHMACQET